jgi:hypothetical protein
MQASKQASKYSRIRLSHRKQWPGSSQLCLTAPVSRIRSMQIALAKKEIEQTFDRVDF